MHRLEVLKSLHLQATSILVQKSTITSDPSNFTGASITSTLKEIFKNKAAKIHILKGYSGFYQDQTKKREFINYMNADTNFVVSALVKVVLLKRSNPEAFDAFNKTLNKWTFHPNVFPDWRFFRWLVPTNTSISNIQIVGLYKKYIEKIDNKNKPDNTTKPTTSTPLSSTGTTANKKSEPHPLDKYKFLPLSKFHADPFIKEQLYYLGDIGKIEGDKVSSMTKLEILYLIKTYGKGVKLENKTSNQTALPKSANVAPKLPTIGSSSTGAKPVLVDGVVYIQKYGASAGHIQSESLANSIYSNLGIDVPETTIKTDNQGKPYQLSKYIDGIEFGKLSENDRNSAILKLRTSFIIDAWLGNWDVVGTGGSNIIVKDGKVYRIDNGGALFFKAQGGAKTLDEHVTEFETMRNGSTNPEAAKVFGALDEDDLIKQFNKYEPLMLKILQAIKADGSTYGILKKRFNYMQERFRNSNYGSAIVLDKEEKNSVLESDIGELQAHPKFKKLLTWYELTTGIRASSKSEISQMINHIESTTCLPYDPTSKDLSGIGMSRVMDIDFKNHEKNINKYTKEVQAKSKGVTDSVTYYTGSAYNYNQGLRFNQQLSANELNDISNVDKFLLYAPKFAGIVYRGFDTNQLVQVILDRFNTKSPLILRGFTSTSIKNSVFSGKPYRMVIQTKSGVYINELSGFKNQEYEVLLPRNLIFNITQVIDNDSNYRYIFYLEEI